MQKLFSICFWQSKNYPYLVSVKNKITKRSPSSWMLASARRDILLCVSIAYASYFKILILIFPDFLVPSVEVASAGFLGRYHALAADGRPFLV